MLRKSHSASSPADRGSTQLLSQPWQPLIAISTCTRAFRSSLGPAVSEPCSRRFDQLQHRGTSPETAPQRVAHPPCREKRHGAGLAGRVWESTRRSSTPDFLTPSRESKLGLDSMVTFTLMANQICMTRLNDIRAQPADGQMVPSRNDIQNPRPLARFTFFYKSKGEGNCYGIGTVWSLCCLFAGHRKARCLWTTQQPRNATWRRFNSSRCRTTSCRRRRCRAARKGSAVSAAASQRHATPPAAECTCRAEPEPHRESRSSVPRATSLRPPPASIG